MYVMNQDNALPIKIWSTPDSVDEKCLEQAANLSKLPFVHKWIALMPDTHAGKGMPIGGVFARDVRGGLGKCRFFRIAMRLLAEIAPKSVEANIRNNKERYISFLESVVKGETKLNAGAMYPYEIVRRCLAGSFSDEERKSLDVTWKSLTDFGDGTENDNALAVVDGSGSMYWGGSSLKPAHAALALGIYFAERNKGAFANHFITFSQNPRLVGIKGADIVDKVQYCKSFNECANTDLEAVFDLILRTACEDRTPAEEFPKRLYIISDMEFDYCIEGGNNDTLFNTMRKKYAKYGYALPEIVFWNVNIRNSHIPVTMSQTGAVLVSGNSPAIFDMVRSGDISPAKIMDDIIGSARYEPICA